MRIKEKMFVDAPFIEVPLSQIVFSLHFVRAKCYRNQIAVRDFSFFILALSCSIFRLNGKEVDYWQSATNRQAKNKFWS